MKATLKPDKNGIVVGITDYSFMELFKRWFPEITLITPEDASKCDLIVLPGGADVNPKHYGATNTGFCYMDEQRDERELAIFNAADEAGVKMYGSCRGLQLINVARGGSLYQDLRDAGRIHRGSHPIEWVLTEKVAKLRKCFPDDRPVNSLHHQGIARLGAGLCTAATFNTIPEIIIGKNVLATQFHPEMMENMGPFFELLTAWAKHEDPDKKPKQEEPKVVEPQAVESIPVVAKKATRRTTVEEPESGTISTTPRRSRTTSS